VQKLLVLDIDDANKRPAPGATEWKFEEEDETRAREAGEIYFILKFSSPRRRQQAMEREKKGYM
jgi:hypothetical protein